MCVEKQIRVASDKKISESMCYSKRPKLATYSIKKVLRSIFKKQAGDGASGKHIITTLSTSLESLDNIRNSQFEDHYEEIEDNTANEKLLSCICDDIRSSLRSLTWTFQQQDERSIDLPYYSRPQQQLRYQGHNDQPEIFVPVRFARTDAGTFFWTTSLKPIAADDDLIQPPSCSSANQRPQLQFQDRWAQA